MNTSRTLSSSASDNETFPVIIVGAGMAGLVAAVSLHESGTPVRVFEASDGVGGRVRSQLRDGFIIDRGFQVLLDAYPLARRWIDQQALESGSFDGAALVWTGRRLVPLVNPLRHPRGLPRDLTSKIFSTSDKFRLVLLGIEAWRAPWECANQAATSLGNDMSASEFLWSRGFSKAFVDRFARPFWGGVTLDPKLKESAGPLLFTLKMFLQRAAVLPKEGVGAMSAQLRNRLSAEAVSLNSRVTSIIHEEGRAVGVRVGRTTILGSSVIIATDSLTAAKLASAQVLPDDAVGSSSVTVFLAGTQSPRTGPRLVLDGTRKHLVNHLAPLSEAQPAYAPAGQHLLAAVIVGDAAQHGDLGTLSIQARHDAAMMLGHKTEDWRVLDVVRVPFSQFSQPPGIYRRLPGNVLPTRNLFLASEATVDSSYNGAMLSGETAASIVRRAVRPAAGGD